ncbi:dihydroxyacetone kinase subunit DhaK [Vibrio breoganii]|uniref:Dihydroxyacetone kinase subunit DhaK n=3 Tax=Vibrio breoganii TaxID=553239 RepID=A0AAJ5JPL0_9VIBR|nr:dihydroxyacetone kinase subunit DhaK [Vibrio breoganii]NMO73581.1 dihydroxyacetone kinase subunit DhaK [Vibrio breoganii]NMR70717.1 dihydroxyacetone kinase subunit DhaK [Vibrio breoganii]OED93002.1 glycerol kinase [Vibrio breoganii ZF-55]PMG02059.1 glycerol kinase [Vibrio breoganii]PMG85199.1 glycerol kinase [Vibrio breoganii]
MKKFINNAENITVELLQGYAMTFPTKIKVVSEKIVTRVTPKDPNKVAIVTLGGAGHEPALSGYVGEGLLDYSVVGDVFAAPGAPKVLEALKMADRPAGVLLVVLNHEGDVMSANMAMEMAAREGINVKMLLTHEDISAGLNSDIKDRRGLAGCVPVYKLVGAAAEEGLSLEEVYRVGEKFNQSMATLAVAMSNATHPQSGMAIGDLASDEMEIGMGQHGEGGGGRMKIQTADDTAHIMIDQLCKAIDVKPGDDLMLMINGSGATTLMEMFIVARACHLSLQEKQASVARSKVEEVLTVQEMAGFQMCIGKFDSETISYWDKPCNAPYWIQQ